MANVEMAVSMRDGEDCTDTVGSNRSDELDNKNGSLESEKQHSNSDEENLKRKVKSQSKLKCKHEGSGEEHVLKGKKVLGKLSKNCRRSRNCYGRGLPKKGGGGGKGTWGKPGSELIVEEEDAYDPNYDSESQDNCKLEAIKPELTEEEFERTLDSMLHEYFEHGDTNEVAITLEDLDIGNLQPRLVEMMVNLSMERKPSHREITSVLLSDLCGRLLTEEDIEQGFDNLISCLGDLVLDIPEAPTMLGNFIARAVADDCIPPKFVYRYRGKLTDEHSRAALEHADTLLGMKHGLVRLDNIWGEGGGMRPVKYLINKMQLLLQEYLSSGDINEATRCLQELEVPHFHHELVYEAVVMVIEDTGERAMDLICKLLKSLAASVILTPDQLKRGFERVNEEMPDICIDVPAAYSILENFISKCHAANFINEELIKKLPSRGRKRFVSDGDGGCVKEAV